MVENFWHKKEKPFAGFAGFGGGASGLAVAGGVNYPSLTCTSTFSGTDGSGDFEGSDYLTVSNGSDWDFGTGDYTAECWFNLDATGDAYLIQMVTDNGGAAPWWGININGSNTIRAGRTDASGDAVHILTGQSISTGTWYHVAVSRASNSSKLFLNGELKQTVTDNDDIDSSSDIRIGGDASGWGTYVNGHISNLRVMKGAGIYTAEFDVPTTPLCATSETTLCCLQDGTDIDATLAGSVSVPGIYGPQLSTDNPF